MSLLTNGFPSPESSTSKQRVYKESTLLLHYLKIFFDEIMSYNYVEVLIYQKKSVRIL